MVLLSLLGHLCATSGSAEPANIAAKKESWVNGHVTVTETLCWKIGDPFAGLYEHIYTLLNRKL